MKVLNNTILFILAIILLLQIAAALGNYTNVNVYQGIGFNESISGSKYSPSVEEEFDKFTFEIILVGIWLILLSYILNEHKQIWLDWRALVRSEYCKRLTFGMVVSVIWLIGLIFLVWRVIHLYSQICINF